MAESIERRRRLARAARRGGPEFADVGFSGINRYGGIVSEEYVADLKGRKAVQVYDKMINDGMVEALFTAISLPIIAASWAIEAAGEDANAKRAAELVEEQLFNRLDWEDEVSQLLTYGHYGFSISAKQWRLVDGEARLAELRPIHPRTIYQSAKRWEYEDGRLKGVHQAGSDGEHWREAFIPASAMVHLVNRGNFRNPEGRSWLRALYKHWFCKDLFYRVLGIGLERGAAGVPIVKYPLGTSSDGIAALKTFVRNVYVNETGYGVFPKDVDLENFTVTSKSYEVVKAIQHMDAEMAKALLAGWLNLGQEGSGGAYALSGDLTDMFLLSLEARGDYIARVVSRTVIPEIVAYNLDTDQFPTLSCTVARRSASQIAAFLQQAAAGANPLISWADADEDWFRELAQLPKRTAPREPAAPEEETADGDARDGEQLSRRERIAVLQEPSRWTEPPSYPALGEIVVEFGQALADAAGALREDFWRIAQLPDPSEQAYAATLQRLPELTEAQQDALARAVERYLVEVAGADRTLEGFIGTDSEDAALQHYEVMAHAIGVDRARELRGADAAAFKPTRESPRVRRVLENAFENLSEDGRLRLEGRVEKAREMLVEAGLNGDNPLVTAKRLEKEFAAMQGHEAERLARTEAATASGWGIIDECEAAEVEMLEPVISVLACEICGPHVGERIQVAEARPGRGGNLAPYHPHCLCSSAPVVE